MYCKNCGNKVDDEAVVCVKCGCIVDENAFIKQTNKNQVYNNLNNSYYSNAIMSFVKLLLVISCVVFAFITISQFSLYFFFIDNEIIAISVPQVYIFYGFLWLIFTVFNIWMTYTVFNMLDNRKHITTGFKIVILLFCNLIAGLLLLCSNADIVNNNINNQN